MITACGFGHKNLSASNGKQEMSPIRALRLCLALCAVLLSCASFGQEPPVNTPSTLPVASSVSLPADPTLLATTKIEPGFLLRVEVADEAQLTGEYDVDAQGAIHFTLADEQGKHKEEWSVKVGQKTAEEAAMLVAESLKAYIRQPNVHVILLKRPRLHVEMAGTGCKPGLLELPLDARLSDVMFVCKQNADYAHLLLVRKRQAATKQQLRLPLPLKPLLIMVSPTREKTRPPPAP